MTSHTFFFPPNLHQLLNSHTWLLPSLLEQPASLATVSLFIYSFLSSEQRAGEGSCLHWIVPHFPPLWWRKRSGPSGLGDGNLGSVLSPQRCCGWCRLSSPWGSGSFCGLTHIRNKREWAVPVSHWSCCALWVALTIRSNYLKINCRSWPTISAFQWIAEIPVITHCHLKCLSYYKSD